MPKGESLGKECVSKNELRVMRRPNEKRFCKKIMQKVTYDQKDILHQDDVKNRHVVVSQRKMLRESNLEYLRANSKRRDDRWRVRIARTKLDDAGKKVYIVQDGKKTYNYYTYHQFIDYKEKKDDEPQVTCVDKEELWSTKNPKHRYCDFDEDNNIVRTVTKAKMIKEYLAKKAKSDKKAAQTDSKVYKSVEIISVPTGKRFNIQVGRGITRQNIDSALNEDGDGEDLIWYDRNKNRVADEDDRDPWARVNTNAKKFYVTNRKTKPPKVINIGNVRINKDFSHRRLVCFQEHDGPFYRLVKSSATFESLADKYPKATLKVGNRVCRSSELVWDATSKRSEVSVVAN